VNKVDQAPAGEHLRVFQSANRKPRPRGRARIRCSCVGLRYFNVYGPPRRTRRGFEHDLQLRSRSGGAGARILSTASRSRFRLREGHRQLHDFAARAGPRHLQRGQRRAALLQRHRREFDRVLTPMDTDTSTSARPLPAQPSDLTETMRALRYTPKFTLEKASTITPPAIFGVKKVRHPERRRA